MELAPFALWLSRRALPPDEASQRDVAAELDDLGFGALWVGGSPPGDLGLAETLLGASRRLVVGTSIVNVWTEPAAVVAASTERLRGRFGDRFVLGLGNSHAPAVEARGQSYTKPLSKLRSYLEELDDLGVPAEARVIAALGPKALELAATATAGAVPYLTTPEHTAQARAAVGDRLLVPEHKIVLERDPERARAVGRKTLAMYLRLPNYVNAWRRLGFEEADLADGGSDRLVDALVAHGEVDTVMARVTEHLDAGADQIAIQPLDPEGRLPREQWRAVADVLPAAL